MHLFIPQTEPVLCVPTAAQKKTSIKIELRITLPQGLEVYYPSTNPSTGPEPQGEMFSRYNWADCALQEHTIPNHSLISVKGALLCMTLICHSFLESSTTDSTTGVGDSQVMYEEISNQNSTSLPSGWRGMGCDQPGTHGSVNKGQREQICCDKFRP